MRYKVFGKQGRGLIKIRSLKADSDKLAVELSIKMTGYKNGRVENGTVMLW